MFFDTKTRITMIVSGLILIASGSFICIHCIHAYDKYVKELKKCTENLSA